MTQNNHPSDRDLIREIQRNNCSKSLEILKSRHIGLIIKIYKKYSFALSTLNFKSHEFYNQIDYIIYTAIQKFDLNKYNTKFSTWLGEYVRYFCLDTITDLNKEKIVITSEPEDIIHLTDEYAKNNNVDKQYNQDHCKYILSILNQLQDERIIKIFNYRYFDGNKKMIWKDIGKKVGLTSQGCLNLHNKAIKFLQTKMKSSNLYDKV